MHVVHARADLGIIIGDPYPSWHGAQLSLLMGKVFIHPFDCAQGYASAVPMLTNPPCVTFVGVLLEQEAPWRNL